MKVNGEVFVKVNYKTIGELKSLIIDNEASYTDEKKYMICTGKYNKDGWTIIFKANSIEEAEALISKKYLNSKKQNSRRLIMDNRVHVLEQDTVQIPAWM